jgi:superfamily II DNA or RNA helicase
LRTSFGTAIGIVGGGEHTLEPLTVTTYDSAYLQMENLGARFGMIVFDECHHLPGETYQLAAELCLAPFRLGLTATPERSDGREALLARLVGPLVYRKEVGELAGSFLADYETERLVVALTAAERAEYEAERGFYLGFLRANGIRMATPGGWNDFVIRSSRSADGQRAMRAYQRQREIAFASSGKLDLLEHLLHRHRAGRVLIFSQDNRTAYAVSRRFLIPVITHQTKVRERSEILERFADGRYGALATSKVLNEGVDVPDANVAIVVSGSGSVREHVQRLGRILRRKDGKRAILYELVSEGTSETSTSERRRDHEAYR